VRIAILPAGGQGNRMARHRPTPKQLLALNNGLVIDYALEAARQCGAQPHVIVPSGDERVARYVHSKAGFASFSYAEHNLLASVYALRPIYGDAQVFYVMPDTVFSPLGIGENMLAKLDFPLIVGIFETSTPQKLGMCVLSGRNGFGEECIVAVEDKPVSWFNEPPFAWGLLAWRKPFWDCLAQVRADNMTEVLARAIEVFGPLPIVWLNKYIDIGTPEDYERALAEGW
jgi:dTDP-glucose pyrophosphorylase